MPKVQRRSVRGSARGRVGERAVKMSVKSESAARAQQHGNSTQIRTRERGNTNSKAARRHASPARGLSGSGACARRDRGVREGGRRKQHGAKARGDTRECRKTPWQQEHARELKGHALEGKWASRRERGRERGVRGCTGGDAEGHAEGERKRNTRARRRRKARRRHAESARQERERTREAAGRGAEMQTCASPIWTFGRDLVCA